MRRLVGAVAVLGMLALAGCGGGEPLPTLPPTPSATPVFASEEEALAAAEQAYTAYLEMSNVISNEGGANPERIAPFVTEEQLPDELAGIALFVERRARSVGTSHAFGFVLQQLTQTGDGAEITVYACVDVSGVKIVDDSGVDVTPVNREPLIALEIQMIGKPGALLIADSNKWPDSQFCFS